MSSKKKVYVLYSLLGDIAPKIYKSKATLKKYMDQQPNLNYYQFKSESQAEEYIRNITKKGSLAYKEQEHQSIKKKKPKVGDVKINVSETVKMVEEQNKKQEKGLDQIFKEYEERKKEREKVLSQMFEDNMKKIKKKEEKQKIGGKKELKQQISVKRYDKSKEQAKLKSVEGQKMEQNQNKKVGIQKPVVKEPINAQQQKIAEAMNRKQEMTMSKEIVIQEDVIKQEITKEEKIPDEQYEEEKQEINEENQKIVEEVKNSQQISSQPQQQPDGEPESLEEVKRSQQVSLRPQQKVDSEPQTIQQFSPSSTSNQFSQQYPVFTSPQLYNLEHIINSIQLQTPSLHKSHPQQFESEKQLDAQTSKQNISQLLDQSDYHELNNLPKVLKGFEKNQKLQYSTASQKLHTLSHSLTEQSKINHNQQQKVDSHLLQYAEKQLKSLLNEYQGFGGEFLTLNFDAESQKQILLNNSSIFKELNDKEVEYNVKKFEAEVERLEKQEIKSTPEIGINLEKIQQQSIKTNESLRQEKLNQIDIESVGKQQQKYPSSQYLSKIDIALQKDIKIEEKQSLQQIKQKQVQKLSTITTSQQILQQNSGQSDNLIKQQEISSQLKEPPIKQIQYLKLEINNAIQNKAIFSQLPTSKFRWYKPTKIQPNLQISPSSRFVLQTHRRQNPGFTTASYKVLNENEEPIYQRSFKIGVTRNDEGLLLATIATLSDALYSQSSLGTNTLVFNISKEMLKRTQESLDQKIVEASNFVNTLKNKGFMEQ